MKCFLFAKGDKNDDSHDGAVSRSTSRVASWARSLSLASSLLDSRRSEFDSLEFLTHPRATNDLRLFTFAELKSATRGFSRSLIVGEGGFGCVYRGVVSVSDQCGGGNGPAGSKKIDVAIKQLDRSGFQGHKEWINEVNFLGVVKHPNLVRLVGYCAEDDERGIQRLLVYELMHNKSLEDHLLARVASPLPWMVRLKIAQDTARGLTYLHEEMDFQLIFRDLKTSNILLDEDFNAKLSDFGLARQGPAAGLGHISTSVVGTAGYAAPEYVQTGKLTAKSDVWSFGVVLYELITGRRALERNLPRNEQKLLEWVRPYVSDSKKLHLILDPRLDGQYCIKSAQKLVSLANECLMKQPKHRPKMSAVVEMLGDIIGEAPLGDDDASQPDKKTEEAEVQEEVVTSKQETHSRKQVFDLKERIGLRTRSIRELYWRNWTPVTVKTR